jgi:hypothetical protein
MVLQEFVLPLLSLALEGNETARGAKRRTLMLAKNETSINIASHSKFFEVSGFFIGYLIFYAVTTPLVMRYWNKNWRVVTGLVENLKSKGYAVN